MFGWTNKKNESTHTLEEKRRMRRNKRVEPIATMTKSTKTTSLKGPRKKISFWERLSILWSTDVAIDLGTANVLIYVKGKGIVLDEPGYVAYDIMTNEVVAIGQEAKEMLGRTPKGIEVIRPLRGGVVADYSTTMFMVQHFVRTVLPASAFVKPRIVACVPSGITPVEKRAVLEALVQAGARKTVLIEEPLAAAMGTGLDKASSVGAMLVDIGGGTTDMAVLCNTGIVLSESIRLGSDDFDEALVEYMRKKKKILIGKLTAEEMKILVGTVDRRHIEKKTLVRGQDLTTGLAKSVEITSKDVQRALERPVGKIVEGVKGILEKTPPELLAQISDHGIILTGGGVLIDGFDRLLTRITGVAAYVVDNPEYSVIMGAGRALHEMNRLQDTLEELR